MPTAIARRRSLAVTVLSICLGWAGAWSNVVRVVVLMCFAALHFSGPSAKGGGGYNSASPGACLEALKRCLVTRGAVHLMRLETWTAPGESRR